MKFFIRREELLQELPKVAKIMNRVVLFEHGTTQEMLESIIDREKFILYRNHLYFIYSECKLEENKDYIIHNIDIIDRLCRLYPIYDCILKEKFSARTIPQQPED